MVLFNPTGAEDRMTFPVRFATVVWPAHKEARSDNTLAWLAMVPDR